LILDDETMVYILTVDRPLNSYEEWQSQWLRYCEYLESIRNDLPPGAYNFATAPWHYDFNDPRSPHDAWVDELVIREPASGERKEHRSLEIIVTLFGAYHDGHIELTYTAVQDYSLVGGKKSGSGHHDWLYDETRLSDRGLVLHEIEWSSGSRWLIECGDVSYKWTPLG